jgi:hypothetical protein
MLSGAPGRLDRHNRFDTARPAWAGAGALEITDHHQANWQAGRDLVPGLIEEQS